MDEIVRVTMNIDQAELLKVREVCELLSISPHTLRYWEKEFEGYLNPYRSKGGHRLYDDHNIRKLLEIRFLLKEELYSINGAKNRLNISARNR
ncbi:MAG: MerR family transcriptional regulator [Calditrichia bacterium]